MWVWAPLVCDHVVSGRAVCEPGPGLGVRSGGLRLRDGAWAEVVDLVALAQSGCSPAACVVF